MKTKKIKNEDKHEVTKPESKVTDLKIKEQIDQFAEIIIEHLLKNFHENKTDSDIT